MPLDLKPFVHFFFTHPLNMSYNLTLHLCEMQRHHWYHLKWRKEYFTKSVLILRTRVVHFYSPWLFIGPYNHMSKLLLRIVSELLRVFMHTIVSLLIRYISKFCLKELRYQTDFCVNSPNYESLVTCIISSILLNISSILINI